MRKKVSVEGVVFVLLFFLCTITGQTTEPAQHVYINALYGYQISYPTDWTLDVNSAANGYVALFDQRALSTQDVSLELLIGIKIEIMSDLPEEDIARLLDGCSFSSEIMFQDLRLQQSQYWQYFQETFMIIVPFKETGGGAVLIAYIPEKNKEAAYWQQFNQIVLSFQPFKASP